MDVMERYKNLEDYDLVWMAGGVAARAYLVNERDLLLVPGDEFVRICVAAMRMHGAFAAAQTAVAFKDVLDAAADLRKEKRVSTQGFMNLLASSLDGMAAEDETARILQACEEHFSRIGLLDE